MTKEEIQQHVSAIKGFTGNEDDKKALKEKLYLAFIVYVEKTHSGSLGEMAAEVLKVKKA